MATCSGPAKQPWVEPGRADAVDGSEQRLADAASGGGSGERKRSAEAEAASGKRSADAQEGDPTQAITFLREGHALYLQGSYNSAEIALKKAVQMDPFSADARIALGKVFLIRGAAARDQAMLEGARLMFEMAHTLDPDAREATLLLELFGPQAR